MSTTQIETLARQRLVSRGLKLEYFTIAYNFDEIRKTLRPALSDIFKDAVTGEDVIVVGVPILKSDGEFKGVLAGMVTIRYSFLAGMFAKWL